MSSSKYSRDGRAEIIIILCPRNYLFSVTTRVWRILSHLHFFNELKLVLVCILISSVAVLDLCSCSFLIFTWQHWKFNLKHETISFCLQSSDLPCIYYYGITEDVLNCGDLLHLLKWTSKDHLITCNVFSLPGPVFCKGRVLLMHTSAGKLPKVGHKRC